MNNNDLRQLFMNQTVRPPESRMTKYDSLKTTANFFFSYSERQGVKLGGKTEFRERFFDFLLNGNDKALTDKECEFFSRYFRYPLKNKYYGEDVFSEYSTALKNFREYVKKLEAKTAELRKLRKGCYPFKILREIEDYIRYMQIQEIDQCLIYADIYNIGRVAGIRQERARRKQKTAPTREEATA